MARFSIPLILTCLASCTAVGTLRSRVLLATCSRHTKVWETVFICIDIRRCQLTVSSSTALWKDVSEFPHLYDLPKVWWVTLPSLPRRLNAVTRLPIWNCSLLLENLHWLRCMTCPSHRELNIHHLFCLWVSLWEMNSRRCKVLGDRLCGLVVRAPGYRTEMYCASCEVRTEFIHVM
jgi:hypothetical protein